MPAEFIRRIQTVWSGVDGTPYYTNLFFDAAVGDIDDLIGSVSTFWNSVTLNVTENLTWVIDPAVPLIEVSTGQIISVAISSIEADGEGSGAETQLARFTQGLMQLRTGVFAGGREIRGRIFIPGPTEKANDDGRPNSDWFVGTTPGKDALLNDVDAELVVYSPTKAMAEPVTAIVNWTEWATLRSRRD
uniref:Uncharacterized protein n=1 Tax=uncultured prokaryote TaxID=198431 RepID=A0A0H5Q610_9ZZZZ|nr:hypothetical protein [uncultured prokaryote]